MLSQKNLAPIILLLVSALTFHIYLYTLSPTVHTGDSGELIAAGYSLGVAHNPGYPLYSMIGKAFCLMGFGNIAFSMNLMSAVCAVLASCFLFWTVYRITGRILPSTFGALLLATSTTVWWQAVVAEVYTLHLLSLSILGYGLTRFLTDKDGRWLYLCAFIFGLSFGNHLSLIMMVPALFCLLWGNRLVRDLRSVLVCALLITLGLSIYIYLPLRAATSPAMNWSNPKTLSAFVYHVGSKEHQSKASATSVTEHAQERLAEILSLLAKQHSAAAPLFIFLVLFGLFHLRHHPRLGAAAILAILFDIVYVLYINPVPLTVTGFGYQSYLVMTMLFAFGLWRLIQRMPRMAAALALCTLVLSIVGNYYENDRSRDCIAYRFARNSLLHIARDAAFLAKGDNQLFTSFYLHAVEGQRPDVSLFDAYGDLALSTEPFQGFRNANMQRAAVEIRESHKAFIFGFRPDPRLMPWAKGAVPRGLGYSLSASDAAMDSSGLWAIYDLDKIDDPSIHKRLLAQEIAAKYHLSKARHEKSLGRMNLWRKELALASLAGPLVEHVRVAIAEEYAEEGSIEDAIREYEAVEKIALYDPSVPNQLGLLYRKLGKNEKAAEKFEAAIRLNPRQEGAAYNLGNALRALGRIDEAISLYQEALLLSPNSADILNNMGQAYKAKGEFEKALDFFRRSSERDPKYLANIGLTYSAMGKYHLAISEYKAALKTTPDSKVLHNNLGTAYRRTGQINEAIVHFEKATRLDPEFLAPRVNLGGIFTQTKSYHRAIANYEAVLRINPGYAIAYLGLGQACILAGNASNAARAWAKFLALAPNDPKAAGVRKALERLKRRGN